MQLATMDWGDCAGAGGDAHTILGSLANSKGNCAGRPRKASGLNPFARPKARAHPSPQSFARRRPRWPRRPGIALGAVARGLRGPSAPRRAPMLPRCQFDSSSCLFPAAGSRRLGSRVPGRCGPTLARTRKLCNLVQTRHFHWHEDANNLVRLRRLAFGQQQAASASDAVANGGDLVLIPAIQHHFELSMREARDKAQ